MSDMSTNHPFISVIIPTYNRANLLPSILNSWREVNKVTAFPYEILFSDDGSLDDSLSILENVNDLPITVIRNEHAGAAHARNAAISVAKGDKILMIGDDIYPDPHILNLYGKKLAELDDSTALLGRVDWHLSLEVNYLMHHITEVGNEQFSFNRLPRNQLTDYRHFYTSNICLDRKLLLKETILFDCSFSKYGYEDIELGYRLSKRGMKIYYYPDAVGYHYHPYDVKSFCKRMEMAGEMAVNFERLHYEIGRIIGIDDALKTYRKMKHVSSFKMDRQWREHFNRSLSAILNQCETLEIKIKNKINQKKNSKKLSGIYRKLFSYYYQVGILKAKLGSNQYIESLLFNYHFHSNIPMLIMMKAKDAFLEARNTISRKICSSKKNIDYPKKGDKTKKLIFVWPIYLAVGGVERNTIEIIRQLKDDYHFVVMTMERLQEKQGSLHHQLVGLAEVIDLAEIVPHKRYLSVLSEFKKTYSPDVIWICNGSPWLSDNAIKIRKLFHDVTIIDQQVYDTKEGWINRYHEKGVQSFDQFIAVNEKIYHVFINQFKMNKDVISLIYPAADTDKLVKQKHQFDMSIVKNKYSLPLDDKKIFLFIGRLVKQKNPFKFIELAENCPEHHFIMIGDGELSYEIDSYLKNKSLNNLFRIPYVAEIAELLSIADATLFVSFYEGLPVVLIESLVLEVPVFSTDVGDNKKILHEYDVGMVIPSADDVPLLVENFKLFVDRIDYFNTQLKKQSSIIAKRFSSREIANQYLALFQRSSQQKINNHSNEVDYA